MLATAIRSVEGQVRRSAGRASARLEQGVPTTPEDADRSDPAEIRPSDERILRVVVDHDGQVEQSEIVSCLDLPGATVSRRLSELEGDGRVDRYRIGRRKVVCTPDRIPEGARSPLEAQVVPRTRGPRRSIAGAGPSARSTGRSRSSPSRGPASRSSSSA